MSMTPAQAVAFKEGSGGFLDANQMLALIQGVGAVAILIYVAWLGLAAYQDFCAEHITSQEMIFIWCRSVFVMMVILYLYIN